MRDDGCDRGNRKVPVFPRRMFSSRVRKDPNVSNLRRTQTENRNRRRRDNLVLYEGRNDQIRNLKDLACRCLRHLVDKRGVNANQVLSMLIMDGHRPKFTVELLIWPLYAPDDLPRFQPDVSRKEITIIKGRSREAMRSSALILRYYTWARAGIGFLSVCES